MACGRPVVGTCFGGTPEVVVDNETGFIVNPFNLKIMSERIVTLLKNPALAEKMGQAGQQRIKEEFNLNQQVMITLAWYKKFLA
jgi:glycosyltransferase involved in cell wall biosynthesis